MFTCVTKMKLGSSCLCEAKRITGMRHVFEHDVRVTFFSVQRRFQFWVYFAVNWRVFFHGSDTVQTVKCLAFRFCHLLSTPTACRYDSALHAYRILQVERACIHIYIRRFGVRWLQNDTHSRMCCMWKFPTTWPTSGIVDFILSMCHTSI